MYQDAQLVFKSTDWLIDTINNHTAAWGVRAQYVTASEYVDAVLASSAEDSASGRRESSDTLRGNPIAPIAPTARSGSRDAQLKTSVRAKKDDRVTFPTVSNGSTFFPFEDWSGYFTSRPYLKGLSQRVHSVLTTAEQLYALRGGMLNASTREGLRTRLEEARRGAAIYQHHDAITGTFCAYAEGCAGEDQDIGSHDVLRSYTEMLETALADAQNVIASVAGATVRGAAGIDVFTTDLQAFGDMLMGDGTFGGDAELVVYNPHAHSILEGITVPVPLCAVRLLDAETGEVVPSQTTATLQIHTGTPPSFDFELAFVLQLPAFGLRRFVVSPARSLSGKAYYGHGCPTTASGDPLSTSVRWFGFV